MTDQARIAPGGPGVRPVWTSGAKSGIGKAINAGSEVVFTMSEGIINEVYYPREDTACIKDIEFIVTDGKDFFSEEKKDTRSTFRMIRQGIPAYHLTNSCVHKKYVIEKEIVTDPFRDTLLQKVSFRAAKKLSGTLQLFVLVSPHINNRGTGNNGWVGDYKGVPMLFADRDGTTVAVACSTGWLNRSVGFAGVSDGWHDLKQHKQMRWSYAAAPQGNVVLSAQIDISGQQDFVIAVGFGRTDKEAGNRARASLLDGFDIAKQRYIQEWENWQRSLSNVNGRVNSVGKNIKTSAAVLRMSEAKSFPGGILASISIPWGSARGDDDLGGYHLVWPRDLAESGGGFLALNAREDVLRIINYLMATQEADGKWWQNMWLEGEAYWTGIQMDQVALPILLVAAADERGILEPERFKRYWPHIMRAVSFIIRKGPATQQDRWEQQPGLNLFTLSTEIAALLAAADLAEKNGQRQVADYCRGTADYWNSQIETWMYVTGTSLCTQYQVDGYYVRTNPFCQPVEGVKSKMVSINQSTGSRSEITLSSLICVDVLSLVRFGLREANDPRIVNTLKVVDATLKVDTPFGPCWHRFTNDAYGENENGDPFIIKGVHGKGRAWPLLTGERGHYEIAAGNVEGALELLRTMESFAENGFLSEQIWDEADIPEKGLYCGRPTCSAMPLSWAHAEYIKLCYSIRNKRVIDMPGASRKRYLGKMVAPAWIPWRFSWQQTTVPKGKPLRVEVEQAAMVRWTDDDWKTIQETDTAHLALGIYFADIHPNKDAVEIKFTFYWKDAGKWEQKDYTVHVADNE